MTSCASNLKQIGLGFLMYVQDYDERIPPNGDWNGGHYWQYRIEPYLKNVQIFACPSDDRGPFNYHEDWAGNPQLMYYGYGNHTHRNEKIAQMQYPAQTVMTNDGVHPAVDGRRGIMTRDCGAWSDSGWCTNDGIGDIDDFIHNQGDNVAFWDGHVKWMQGRNLWDGVGIYW